MTLKPPEAVSAIDWEAINPELVKAIRRAKQSGPVMTSDEFKAWLDTLRGGEPPGQRASRAGLAE